MTEIIRNIPLWVPPLFILLLVLGLRARHRRTVPVLLIYLIPLLSLLSLRAISSLPAPDWIWGVFGLMLAAGVLAGRRWQSDWTIARQGNRVEVKGEIVTLALLMTVFAGNFALRVLAISAPDALGQVVLQIGFAVLLGFVSGVFVGRALQVWRTKDAQVG